MTAAYERRVLPTTFEVRSVGNRTVMEGYALKWDIKSQNLGGFREKVQEGATTKTIAEADIRALINHDPNLILGRNRSNTLRLAEDSTGLHYEVDLGNQSYARDLAESMERGDVTQSSFGFRTIKDDWNIDEDDFPIRTLQEVALTDVSPVTYPAYIDATSGIAGRALVRFAETRNLDLAVVEENLAAVIRGEYEPEPEERALPEVSTLILPTYDTAFDAALRARMLAL